PVRHPTGAGAGTDVAQGLSGRRTGYGLVRRDAGAVPRHPSRRDRRHDAREHRAVPGGGRDRRITGFRAGRRGSIRRVAGPGGAASVRRYTVKIVELETFLVPPRWCFLAIHTDEGITGWGEPVVEGRAATVATAVHELSEYLVGSDPFRIED